MAKRKTKKVDNSKKVDAEKNLEAGQEVEAVEETTTPTPKKPAKKVVKNREGYHYKA